MPSPPTWNEAVPPGTVLLGKYRIDSILGKGGMGIVAEATHLALGEKVAIKMLRPDVVADGEACSRFLREAQAAVKLKSEHVARVTDVGTLENGSPYMVMEFLEGVDLDQMVTASGVVAPQLAVEFVLQGCEALAEAHSLGIIHRDVKPSNFFVTWRPDGTPLVKVLDFGISKAPVGVDLALTRTQSVLGTPAYMSPEQSADRALTAASDWYSVGAMLYEVLTGRRPFEGKAAEVILAKQKRDPAPPEGCPEDLAALAMHMLRREPADRPDGHEIVATLGGKLSPWTHRIAERFAHAHAVGRTEEMEELRQALADSRDHVVAVVVLGPCGSGKTTLIDAFVDELRSAGETVLLAGKASAREALPFRAIDRIIDSLGAYLMSLPEGEAAALVPPGIAALARVFPALRRVPAAQVPILPGTMPTDENELRRRAFVAMCDIFRAIAERHPLVIPLDDMQWGTAAGSRVMNDFFEGADAPRCLILFGHRSEDPDSPLLQHLRIWKGDLRTITLDPLPVM